MNITVAVRSCPVSPSVLFSLSLKLKRGLRSILLKFCLFQHSFTPAVYCPSGVWAKDKLCACGKCPFSCSSLYISNNSTHVTACWTHWTLVALKQCWFGCPGFLAWVSWGLEWGGRHQWGVCVGGRNRKKKNKGEVNEYRLKRGLRGDVAMGKHSKGISAFSLLPAAQCLLVVLLFRCELVISGEAWEPEGFSLTLVPQENHLSVLALLLLPTFNHLDHELLRAETAFWCIYSGSMFMSTNLSAINNVNWQKLESYVDLHWVKIRKCPAYRISAMVGSST